MGAEQERVAGLRRLEDGLRQAGDWYYWGPYVSARQWGTVREDCSPGGGAWDYFPHDHARSRAYRWGEDGPAGFSDIEHRLGLGLALRNGRDPKERPFGLTGRRATTVRTSRNTGGTWTPPPVIPGTDGVITIPGAPFPARTWSSRTRPGAGSSRNTS